MVTSAKNLTERRFRGYWEATDKAEANENVRFRTVLRAMEADVTGVTSPQNLTASVHPSRAEPTVTRRRSEADFGL